jgi:hypothetical protein
MKTIAVSIDEPTMRAIDEIARPAGAVASRRRGGGGPPTVRSRSDVFRQALQEFVERTKKTTREARERRVFAKHRARLARQAKALIAEQAKR